MIHTDGSMRNHAYDTPRARRMSERAHAREGGLTACPKFSKLTVAD